MTKKIYNKLVRDFIPQIITQERRSLEVSIYDVAGFEAALREKLVEESLEAQNAEPEKLVIELADVMEVIEALIELKGIPMEELKQIQDSRRRERGSFNRRLKLLWTE